MPVHEEVLREANRIASGTRDRTFGVEAVVCALPHLNPSTVRTHIVSRCCVNAPKNHPHKWDYFRRVGRGRYQVLPPYREDRPPQPPARDSAGTTIEEAQKSYGAVSQRRRDTIHAVVYKEAATYVAECLELAVVTQGSTLDEVMANLKRAVRLHLDGEDLAALGLADHLRLQLTYDALLGS